MLESCSLHTVLDCPDGAFQGSGVKTVVLFFEKGAKTRKVWFYQLDPGRNLGKTWSFDGKSIDPATFDLQAKNPNGGEKAAHRSPEDIRDEIAALDAESAAVLQTIRGLL
jgi:type I restriction enzyme M protein